MVTICQLQGEQQFKFRFKFHLNSPGQLGEPNLPFCSPAVMNSAVNVLLLMNCEILFALMSAWEIRYVVYFDVISSMMFDILS